MLQQLSVGKKLALAFTAVGVVMLGVAGVSYFGLRTIGALVVEVADIEASRSAHARDLERDVLELRRFEKEMALAVGDRARLESYAKQWREAYERTREGALRLDALLDDPTEKQDLARGMRNLRAHEQGMTEVLAELRDGKITTPSAANDAMKTHDESVRVVEELSRDLARAHEERMHAALPQVQARAREVSLELLALLCIGTLLSIAVTLGTTRSITTPLLQLTTAARRIASGDLSVEVSRLDRKDEIGTLVEAFREMSINTQGLVRSLQEGVTQLSASASQIGATARQYAATAAEQAASVAEVSTTIDEINQTSQVAASSAREIAEGAEAASESGQLGRAKLGEAVEVIQTINERVSGIAHQIVGLAEQTSQIGTIVDAVNDLAEQSNLLAVNASIEAAKAGENGRGFAVVATEVRSLAEQSKRATQQIRTILGQIQKATQSAVMATEEGTKRAEDGRRAIEAVRVAVDDIGAVLEDSAVRGRQIAGTASQQASGVSQIASAIEGLARAGQDNAKGVKQLEQAVLDLGRLSLDLKTTSQRFRA